MLVIGSLQRRRVGCLESCLCLLFGMETQVSVEKGMRHVNKLVPHEGTM